MNGNFYVVATESREHAHSQSSPSSSLSSSTSTTSGSQSPAGPESCSSLTQSSSTDTNGHVVVPSSQRSPSILNSYKLVGDNLDKHVTPREMRVDHQAQSLHYFNCYAVKDRISTFGLEDNPSLPDFSAFSEGKILPTEGDHESLMSNLVILVSRVVKKHFPFFSKFGTGVPKHIEHKFYVEMAKKSEIVSISIVFLHLRLFVTV